MNEDQKLKIDTEILKSIKILDYKTIVCYLIKYRNKLEEILKQK